MKKDIKQIIAEGESQQTKFKSSFNVEAMESITAFANTKGGCVLVGILKLATKVATSSRQYFRKVFLAPAFKEGFIDLLYPDKPNHPKQKYYLTEKGKEVLKALEA